MIRKAIHAPTVFSKLWRLKNKITIYISHMQIFSSVYEDRCSIVNLREDSGQFKYYVEKKVFSESNVVNNSIYRDWNFERKKVKQ